MQQGIISPLLLTIKEVMEELKLSRSKVESLIKREGLPIVPFGRAIRVNRTSLEQWLIEREHNYR